MVLTSQAHRRRTTKKNRRIPTIPAGRFNARLVNVSTVDTRPRRSEPGVLAARPGTSVTGPPHRPLPAICAGARWSWFDSGPALSLASGRPAPRGSGSTGQGLCLLHEGPTYPKCTPPSSSSTPPSCSACRRRRQPPQRPRQPLSGRLKQHLSHPADAPHQCLRCHDIRNSQKS